MALKFYDSPFHVTHDDEKASKMALKMDLSIMLGKLIKQREWTQVQAAEALGVTQSRVSDLVNGKIDRFTLDALFDMLDTLGFRARVSMDDGPELDQAQVTIKRVQVAAA